MNVYEDIAEAILFDHALRCGGNISDFEILRVAVERAHAKKLDPVLLQEYVCTRLFHHGYEYHDPTFVMPKDEFQRRAILERAHCLDAPMYPREIVDEASPRVMGVE